MGESLAAEMGKTYQFGQNCRQSLDSISTARATTLFQNYLEEPEVKRVMERYRHAIAGEKGKSCNLELINISGLMYKMGAFMHQASRLQKNKQQ